MGNLGSWSPRGSGVKRARPGSRHRASTCARNPGSKWRGRSSTREVPGVSNSASDDARKVLSSCGPHIPNQTLLNAETNLHMKCVGHTRHTVTSKQWTADFRVVERVTTHGP